MDTRRAARFTAFFTIFAAALPTVGVAQCPDGRPGDACNRAAPARIDSQAVVVLPFTVRGPDNVRHLGDGMVDLFQIALDGIGGLRVVHPPSAAARLGQLAEPSSIVAAAPVARALGARHLVGGTIFAVGDEIRINAEFFDAVRGRSVVQANGRGGLGRVGALVDSIAAVFVLRTAPSSSIAGRRDRGMYISRSPGAIQAYLSAEKLIRAGKWQEGADSLKSAMRLDPDFGWPYYTFLRVQGNHQSYNFGVTRRSVLDSALSRLDRFTPRIRGLMFSQLMHDRGQRQQALDLSSELARAYPDDPDVAYRHADVHFHFGLNLGVGRDHVLRLLERAVALDPDQPEAFEHYVLMLAEVGDTAAAWASLRRARTLAPESITWRTFEDAFRLVFDRLDPVSIVAESGNRFQSGAGAYQVEGTLIRLLSDREPAEGVRITDSLAAAVLAVATTRPPRSYELIRRSQLAIANGRYRDAWAFLDQARLMDSTHPGVRSRTVLYGLLTGLRTDDAVRQVGRYRASLPPLDQFSALLLHEGALAEPESLEVLIAHLATQPDTIRARAIATGMRGLLALRRGDSIGAREALTRALEVHTRMTGIPSVLWPNIPFALALTRLDLAAGDPRAALRHLADAYPGHEAMLYFPDIEELRARACEALNDLVCARRSWQNLAKLLERADPEVQPRREAALASVARLVRP
jgi:TolB-like protein/tetratricopeptide (TPR) repeat protein